MIYLLLKAFVKKKNPIDNFSSKLEDRAIVPAGVLTGLKAVAAPLKETNALAPHKVL